MLAYVPPDILTWHCFMQIKMRNVIGYMKTLKVYKVKVSQFEKQQLLCDGCGSNVVHVAKIYEPKI